MVNRNLFQNKKSSPLPANTKNAAGGIAYCLEDEEALAQLALTGCFNNTFYAAGKNQLSEAAALVKKVSPEFVAKLAVYARQNGRMKDMPAFLLTQLACMKNDESNQLFHSAFPLVVNNFKVLRTFLTIFGSSRKSLGNAVKNQVRRFLKNQDAERLFRSSIGQSPNLGQVIKMVHSRPEGEEKAALYSYVLDKEHNKKLLPKLIRDYERFKDNKVGEVPDVDFRMLSNLDLSVDQWKTVAIRMGWDALRQELNAFARRGCFNDKKFVDYICERLSSAEEVRKFNVFPYQIYTTYVYTLGKVPAAVSDALQVALHEALQNVPDMGRVIVAVDISTSMTSPVTGSNNNTSVVRCVDLAGLVTAAYKRVSKECKVIAFNDRARVIDLNKFDSVVRNTKAIADLCSGGTKCSSALSLANNENLKADVFLFVSDNESWMGGNRFHNSTTETVSEWKKFKGRNKSAKLICLNIQPETSTQAYSDKDVLNCSGFSDSVFTTIGDFARGDGHNAIDRIRQVSLESGLDNGR